MSNLAQEWYEGYSRIEEETSGWEPNTVVIAGIFCVLPNAKIPIAMFLDQQCMKFAGSHKVHAR